MLMPTEIRALDFPSDGAVRNCESPDVNVGSQTCILCKSSICS